MKTLTILPFESLRVLKQISIVSDFGNIPDHSIGYMLYERMLSPDYIFTETPDEQKDFSYYLEYPRQDHFPTDRIDNIILQSVKNLYPKSRLRNFQVVSNFDEDNIKTLQRNTGEKSHILFTPSFSNLDFSQYAGKSFDCLRKKIIIYPNCRKEDLRSVAFTGFYDLADKTILDDLDQVNFI